MADYTNTKVQKDSSGFPSTLIPKKDRGKDWVLEWGKEIYQRYKTLSSRSSESRWSASDSFHDLRMLALGSQPTERLKQRFELAKGQDGNTQTGMNIDWDAIGVAKKYINLACEYLLERRYDPSLDVLDPTAQQAKRMAKAREAVKIQRADFISSFLKSMGASVQKEEGMPKTIDELDIYFEMGGYKNMIADAAERLMQQVLMENGWTPDILPDLIREFVITGLVGAGSYVRTGNELKTEYIRVEDLVLPDIVGGHFDVKKLPYIGRMHRKTKDDIYREAGDEFSEKDYKKIFSTDFNSREWDRININQRTYNSDKSLYKDVLEFYFYAENTQKHRVRDTEYGSYVDSRADDWEPEMEEDEDGNQKQKNPKVRKLEQKYRQVYQGFWIVGSPYIYSYGEMPHSPRQRYNDFETAFPISILSEYTEAMQWRSIADIIVELVNMIQSCWTQIQNQLGNIIPPGVIEDTAAQFGMFQGQGGVEKRSTVLKAFKQTGNYSFNSMAFADLGMAGWTQKFVEPHSGFYPEAVDKLFQNIFMCINMLEGMIGFNDATNAGTSSDDSLVRVQQMQAQGTVRSTNYLVRELHRGLRSFYWTLLGRIQSVIQSGDHQFKENAGAMTTEVIDRLKDLPMTSFGVDVIVGASEAERLEVEEYLKIEMNKNAANPGSGLEVEDVMMIRQLPTVKAQLAMLKVLRKRRKAEAQQNQMQAQEMELKKISEANQGQKQLVQMKAQLDLQEKMAVMQQKLEGDMAKQREQIQADMAQQQADIMAALQSQQMKSATDVETATITADATIEKQQLANQKPVNTSN